tara:strand:- start:290 stop:1183 length:894 start_codon:yes stop_codon:yes gene_type:complete
MNELATSLLEHGRELLVHKSHSYASDLSSVADAIGCHVKIVDFGNTWLRDEFIRTTEAVLRVKAAVFDRERWHRNSLRRYRASWGRLKLHEAIGIVGGHTLGEPVDKDDYPDEFKEIDFSMEGGNMIVLSKVVLVGAHSIELYAHLKDRSFVDDFCRVFGTKRQVHVVPQLLYHLDLFILPISNDAVFVPDGSVLTSEMKTSLDASLHGAGLSVFQIDGIVKDGCGAPVGNYFSGLCGANDGAPFLVLPSFGARHDRKVSRQIWSRCNHAISIYFIGRADANRRQFKLGAGVRCGCI